MRTHINGLRCSKCRVVKANDDFYANSSREDGYHPHCKKCCASYPVRKKTGKRKTKKWVVVKNSGYSRALLRRFYNYPNQSSRRKIAFNLTLDEFCSITSSTCFYCGLFSPNKDYVGIDRIDSKKNYTPDNCVPCCSVCNKMKGDLEQPIFFAYIKLVASRLPT